MKNKNQVKSFGVWNLLKTTGKNWWDYRNSVADYYATDPDLRHNKTIEIPIGDQTGASKSKPTQNNKAEREERLLKSKIEHDTKQKQNIKNEMYIKDFSLKDMFVKKENRRRTGEFKEKGITKDKIVAAAAVGDTYGFFKYSFSLTVNTDVEIDQEEREQAFVDMIDILDKFHMATTKTVKNTIVVSPNLDVMIDYYNSKNKDDNILKFEKFVRHEMGKIVYEIRRLIRENNLSYLFTLNLMDEDEYSLFN